MNTQHLNPLGILYSLTKNRYLLTQLIKRDVLLKYRGAFFGVLWVFLNPLILLAVFSLIFGHIFPSRWPEQGAQLPNAVMLFAGLMTIPHPTGDGIGRPMAAVAGTARPIPPGQLRGAPSNGRPYRD